MAVYKEEKTNTWRVLYRYTDWNGERKQSQKRGEPFPVEWTVKSGKKQSETQDIS